MITKKIAGDLYGNSFMLQDKEGGIYIIESLGNNDCFEANNSIGLFTLRWDKIGIDYHILARPLSDLTKEITHKGETFVPIVELAKIVFPDYFNWKIKDGVCQCFTDGIVAPRKNEFYFEKDSFRYWSEEHRGSFKEILNQFRLFDKLRELNFAIGLPEGSWIPVTDNNNPYK